MKKTRKAIGMFLEAWGGVRLIVDLLGSIDATKEFAKSAYVQIVSAPSSRTLTIAVVVVGSTLLLFEPVKNWWVSRSGEPDKPEKSKGAIPGPTETRALPPPVSRPEVTLDYTHPRRSRKIGQQLKMIRNRPFTLAVSKQSAYNIEVKPIETGGGKAVFAKQAILHVSEGKKEIQPTVVKPSGPMAVFWRHEFDWLVIDEWEHRGAINAQFDIEIQIEYEDSNGTAWGTKEVLHFAPITLETIVTHVEFIGPLSKQRAS